MFVICEQLKFDRQIYLNRKCVSPEYFLPITQIQFSPLEPRGLHPAVCQQRLLRRPAGGGGGAGPGIPAGLHAPRRLRGRAGASVAQPRTDVPEQCHALCPPWRPPGGLLARSRGRVQRGNHGMGADN